MSIKTTKKELKELCEQLGAVRLGYNGRPCGNIYTYNNARYYYEQEAYKAGKFGCSKCIAYSAGAYDNTGRLDYCEATGQFVCWY